MFRSIRSVPVVAVLTLFILFISSCSLLKFNIETQTTPLEPGMLKIRMQTHNFAREFFHEVMYAFYYEPGT